MTTNHQHGALLIEVLIGTAILAGVLVALAGALNQFNLLAVDNLRKTQATFLAVEGLEALRAKRDTSWAEAINSLAREADYYLVWQTDHWDLSATPSLVDNRFDRRVSLSDVYRDANNDIAATGTFDPDTILATARVSWLGRGGTTTKEIAAYLTNLFAN